MKILDLAHRLTSLAELTRCGSIHTLSSTNPPAKEYEYLPFAISGDSPVMGKVVVETVLDKCLRDGINARKLKLPESNYFKNSTPVPFAILFNSIDSPRSLLTIPITTAFPAVQSNEVYPPK